MLTINSKRTAIKTGDDERCIVWQSRNLFAASTLFLGQCVFQHSWTYNSQIFQVSQRYDEGSNEHYGVDPDGLYVPVRELCRIPPLHNFVEPWMAKSARCRRWSRQSLLHVLSRLWCRRVRLWKGALRVLLNLRLFDRGGYS